MGSLKSLTLLALLFSLSLAVIADTSNDATHAKDEVKPSEETDAIEPQQGGRGGCRYGCCGSYAYGQCSACCSRPQAVEAKAEANKQPQAVEAKAEGNDVVVEPQQWWPGGCRYGCCGVLRRNGRCSYCCRRPQDEINEAVEAVEPQQSEKEKKKEESKP
ncbi:Late embryogenesis abundant protein M10 [Cardamine amara subsp. amara]|uniref:Late embryogenesis abundant protein M10 n=1 Tax=Cardamine amara subsp. amara TaxID=228776 RepID=A0ABD1BUA2_CARAN